MAREQSFELLASTLDVVANSLRKDQSMAINESMAILIGFVADQLRTMAENESSMNVEERSRNS